MSVITRVDREQELLRYLRVNPQRLQAEYRRVLGISVDAPLPNGISGAMLIMGILNREYETQTQGAQGDTRLKPAAK